MDESLESWIDDGDLVERLYQEELGRPCESLRAGMNWLWHRRQNGESEETIRAEIRTSPEWIAKHPGGNVDFPPPPQPPPIIDPGTPNAPINGERLQQITNDDDGGIINRGYSYYSNAWIAPDNTIHLFCGTRGGPRFFKIRGNQVQRDGNLVRFGGETEGWGWTPDGRLMVIDGTRLLRINPRDGTEEIVMSYQRGNSDLWQAHWSNDGTVFSATVREIRSEGGYPHIGTVVNYRGDQRFFAAEADLDESQITADGRYLLIKEGNFNRIIECGTWTEFRISNEEGALGHSDVGDSIAIGEDDQLGACVVWHLPTRSKRPLFSTWNMGHVSYNAGKLLLANDTQIALVAMDGSGNLQNIVEHGMRGVPKKRISPNERIAHTSARSTLSHSGIRFSAGSKYYGASGRPRGLDYDHQVFANLDHTARVAEFVSNRAGSFHVFIARLP